MTEGAVVLQERRLRPSAARMRRHFFLLKELVKRDFQGRFAGSLLGLTWSFVQPLWLLVLFTFVFSTVMQVRLPGAGGGGRFATFLFCGLLPWMAVNEGVTRAATAVTDNATLVRKLRFPAEVLVLAAVAAALLQEGIAAAIFTVVLAVLGELAWQGLPLLVLALALQLLLTVGLGLLLCALHIFLRDTAQLLGLLFTGWFYLTPIVYPLAAVPARFRFWIELNPLTALVGLYRQAFLGGKIALVPGTAALAVVAGVLGCAGLWLFRRLKSAFVDEI